ncbi:MAG: lytic transglycosylase domain-containing protein [Moraxellaceae bacterium]|nr:MAG: lytic transglycosylase domain-containing protein [Moraxellaceae bacterium]
MATIDELVIKFMLDDTEFTKGKEKAKKELSNLKSESTKHTKEMEDGFKKLATGVNEFKKVASEAFVLLAGTTGLTTFITQIVQAEAELGRLSAHTGQATQDIHALGNVVELVGGKADEAAQGASRFAKEFTDLKYKGEMGSLMGFLSQMAVLPVDATNKMRDYNSVLLDLAEQFDSGRFSKDEFFNLATSAGLGAGEVDAIMKGRVELQKMLDAQQKNALVTAKQAEKARELIAAFTEMKQQAKAMGREFFDFIVPYLEGFLATLQRLGQWCSQNQDFIVGALTAIAVVVTATLIPAFAGIMLAVAPILILAAAVGLLWDSYQVWKRGGKSFIDWDKWEPEIKGATKAVSELWDAIVKLIGTKENADMLKKTLSAVGRTIAQEFSEALNMITNVATALKFLAEGHWAKAARVLISTESNAQIEAMTDEQAAKPIPKDKLSWDMGVFGSLRRIGDAALQPFGLGNGTNDHSVVPSGGSRNNGVMRPATPYSGDIIKKQQHLGQLEKAYGLPAGLLDSIWAQESRRGQNKGKSSAGAMGDFQFMPATATRFNVKDRMDFHQSANGAAQYLTWLIKRYKGNLSHAVAAYNAGEGNVDKYHGIPPFKETRNYVPSVLNRMQKSKTSPVMPYGIGARQQMSIKQGSRNHTSASTVETTIGTINIHTQATDAAGIAASIQPALENSLAFNSYAADKGMS